MQWFANMVFICDSTIVKDDNDNSILYLDYLHGFYVWTTRLSGTAMYKVFNKASVRASASNVLTHYEITSRRCIVH